ncbi:MAG: nuclear transport factor 2 family protein [Deltaproteobacteria bacterium]|nr:nuclear transport factor 2 family protein [Deltaproteobacteria bacterium]
MKTGIPATETPTNEERLLTAYAAYNRQDSEALLALVSEDVDWPNGSARLHGKAALQEYWTRQWEVTRTHDEPVKITHVAPDRSVVRISQVVRALDGTRISEGTFDHVHRFRNGLITHLEIQNVDASPR